MAAPAESSSPIASAPIPNPNSSQSYTSLTIQNIGSMVPIRLLGLIDGTEPCPSPFLADRSLNPAFEIRYEKDQDLVICFNSTLSEEVIPFTVGVSSSRDLCLKLEPLVDNSSYSVDSLFPEDNPDHASGAGGYDDHPNSIYTDAPEDGCGGGYGHGYGSSAPSSAAQPLPDNVRKEIPELGFPDDGYNNLLHTTEIRNTGGGSAFYQNSKAKLGELPRDEKSLKAALTSLVGQSYLKEVSEFVITASRNRDPEVVLEGVLDAVDWCAEKYQQTARSALRLVMENCPNSEINRSLAASVGVCSGRLRVGERLRLPVPIIPPWLYPLPSVGGWRIDDGVEMIVKGNGNAEMAELWQLIKQMQPQHTKIQENLGELQVGLDESNDEVALDESEVALVKAGYGKIVEESYRKMDDDATVYGANLEKWEKD